MTQEVVLLVGPVQSVRALTATPAATSGLALQPGSDALHDQRTLELGEHAEHLHHHPAGRGAGVERLGRGAEDHTSLVKLVNDLRKPTDRPGEAIYAVDEQHIEPAELCVPEEAGECGPVDHGPGELVLIAPLDPPLRLAGHERIEPHALCL
ncbi:MAG TPA: hypothetical protein VK778_16900 [Solirubrobacteraceae bacterium]|nr:hypothetical protein [Solirubrobacteraceae bacterium]